jgi:protein-tyrosine phosphatase
VVADARPAIGGTLTISRANKRILMGLPDYIDHVIDGVYIADDRAAFAENALRAEKITTVLKLYHGAPFFPMDFNTLDHPLDDGAFILPDDLQRGVKFIAKNVDAGRRVLIVCCAGISRSSTFALAYLLERGHDLRDAYTLLVEKHRFADPHPELWRSLIEYYHVTYTLEDIAQWTPDV